MDGQLKSVINKYDPDVVILGACPRIESQLRKSWIRPYFPMIFVKYTQYSPQIMEKYDSNPLPSLRLLFSDRLLGFYANDPSDSSASNLFKVENGALAVNSSYYVPGPSLAYKLNQFSLFRWLSENSYLYSFMTKNASALITQMRTGDSDVITPPATAISIATNTPDTSDLFERERLLIERMYKFCQDNGAKLIILDMPDIISYKLDKAEQYSRDFKTSVPKPLRKTMTDHSDYFLNSERVLAKYRGVAELRVPHGQRHLTEFCHLIYGMKATEVIKSLIH